MTNAKKRTNIYKTLSNKFNVLRVKRKKWVNKIVCLGIGLSDHSNSVYYNGNFNCIFCLFHYVTYKNLSLFIRCRPRKNNIKA